MTTPKRYFGTEYLTVEGFLDKLSALPDAGSFTYATGDLAYSAHIHPEVFALRNMVWRLYEAKKVALTQRARADLSFSPGGGRAFDYIATKRSEIVVPGGKR